MKSQPRPDLTSLLAEMPLSPPEGYHYEVEEYRRNIVSFWLCGGRKYLHRDNNSARTIHSFYDYKKNKWYSPINSKKMGNEVAPEDMRPWTAMPLNLNPLMSALYA